jgi:hypothetical protein
VALEESFDLPPVNLNEINASMWAAVVLRSSFQASDRFARSATHSPSRMM